MRASVFDGLGCQLFQTLLVEQIRASTGCSWLHFRAGNRHENSRNDLFLNEIGFRIRSPEKAGGGGSIPSLATTSFQTLTRFLSAQYKRAESFWSTSNEVWTPGFREQIRRTLVGHLRKVFMHSCKRSVVIRGASYMLRRLRQD